MHPPTASPRLVATLAIALALVRHGRTIHDTIQAMLHAARNALTTTRTALQLCAQTSNDMQRYLHASTPGRLSRGARRQQVKQLAPSIPRSVRRLLRLLASEDGLSVLHHVAGGAARGLAREMRRCSDCVSVSQNGFEQVVECLASPSGQRVVNGAVATAVREGIQTFCQMQQPPQRHANEHWTTRLINAALSDKGQQLVLKLALELTRTVVPIVMHANNTQSVGTYTASAQVTPLIKRQLSFSSRPPAPGQRQRPTAEESGGKYADESPVTKDLVMSAMHAQGRMGVVERLALLAIRDKQLVREVVRTVVSEAVRTYLRTQAELSGGASSGSSSSSSVHGQSQGGVQQSLWKALIQSALVDVKRALLSRGADATGWLVF